jgi:hypothetical protein
MVVHIPSDQVFPLTTLPAAGTVNIPEEQRIKLTSRFRNAQEALITAYTSEITATGPVVAIAAGVAGFLIGLAALVPNSLIILPLIPVTLVATIIPTCNVCDARQSRKELTSAERQWTTGPLRDAFLQAQKEAYDDQKRQIVHAAEQHLSSGRLISTEGAAWLATINPSILRTTSDQLAITVLQIRKIIRYARGAADHQNPLTFVGLDLNPTLPRHRSLLRDKLLMADTPLPEDGYPNLMQPQLLNATDHNTSFLHSLRACFSFSLADVLRREFTENLPRFNGVKVQSLLPVQDFAAALQHYEMDNPPLDLPALRGWPDGSQLQALKDSNSFDPLAWQASYEWPSRTPSRFAWNSGAGARKQSGALSIRRSK